MVSGHERVVAPGGNLLLKWGPRARIEAEYHGLQLLEAQIPDCIPTGRSLVALDSAVSILTLPWVETVPWTSAHWQHLADILGRLRLPSDTPYGLERDNFIGPTPQKNYESDHWEQFVREQRLYPMLDRLELRFMAQSMLHALATWLPERPPPFLCHGDLWSGNVIPTHGGRCMLIDPALHVGDIWMDVAMLSLFGSPPRAFLEQVAEVTGTDIPSDECTLIYQLYHVLNHAILFGGGYHDQAIRMIRHLNQEAEARR